MTQTTRSPVLRLEEQFSLQDKLTGAGYQSVFDIVRQSRSQFIKKHRPAWGSKSAKVYDHALGYANQLTRLFRTSKVAQAMQKQKTRNTSGNLQGLQKNGPTWQSLFQDNWGSYCLNSAPEANDSPVSYLSWLYNQAQDFENQMGSTSIIPLATRRPDLPNLMLDDDAINQVIPSLQLVNEVLEASVEPYVGTDTTVDKTLSTTRYPTALPYHYPHQQALLSLENDNESLQDIIKKTDTAWPYFVRDDLLAGNASTAWQLGSNLAPEQMTILTEPDNSTASDLTAFYQTNFGLATADYMLFEDVDVLCKQLGITTQQLEQMLASSAGNTTAVASPNYPADAPVSSADYGATFINSDGGEPVAVNSSETPDVISNSTSNTLHNTNTTVTNGRFGEGLQTRT
ncbi:TPA: virulence protein SpvA, partial [Salmonella enterica subsp. enterica serovar Saintpaul str. CFSAN004144]|nr:virulence protein SpvA [Salmonella enterica subsp. enterica serovar Saintpaul str. CFSAN004144]